LDLFVHREGGFSGPIDLVAEGLPEGVRIEPAQVPAGQVQVRLAVVAKDDVRPTDAAVRLRGKATIAGRSVERRIGDVLHLTVQHKPIFRLTCSEAYQYAHRGTIYPYAMKVERLNGFTGPVTIQLCERQVQDLDGIEIVETVVPA